MAAAGAFVAIVIAAGERLEVPLTTRQLRCLLIIARRGPLNLIALADSMKIHPSSATRLCDGLVEARLIRRGQAEHDRRNLELTVTARGQRIIDRLVAERQRVLSDVIAAMPPDELAAAGDRAHSIRRRSRRDRLHRSLASRSLDQPAQGNEERRTLN